MFIMMISSKLLLLLLPSFSILQHAYSFGCSVLLTRREQRHKKTFYLNLSRNSISGCEDDLERRQDNDTYRQQKNYAANSGTDTRPKSNTFANDHDSSIIASQGKTANFMLAWPTITTFTLVKGWDQETTSKLRLAVQKVVKRNPILTGRATLAFSPFNPVKISIVMRKDHDLRHVHNFVHEIDLENPQTDSGNGNVTSLPPDLKFENMDGMEILQFMDDFLAPIIPTTESVFSLAMDGGPLFRIDVIQLPNSYACYVVSMSHCVGDGVTYYNIMQEIKHSLDDQHGEGSHTTSTTTHDHHEEKRGLQWSHPDIAFHEVFPSRFSNRDIEFSYGGPFFLGLLKNSVNIKKQKISYIVIDKEAVEKKRRELSTIRDSSDGHLSHNDIITAALCEANLSSKIFAFTMNMRDRHSHFGGNFHNEIPFPKNIIADPYSFRAIVKDGFYYAKDELPLCPFVLGQVGRISSLATVQKLIQNDKVEVICHSMLSSFGQNVPLDTAFIISMNKSSYVILHNFRELDLNKGLLCDLTQSSSRKKGRERKGS